MNADQFVIFDDDRFKHGASPLDAETGEGTTRDALVCTADYCETYLAATA